MATFKHTIKTIVTILYIRPSELIHLIIKSLYHFINLSPFPQTSNPGSHQSLYSVSIEFFSLLWVWLYVKGLAQYFYDLIWFFLWVIPWSIYFSVWITPLSIMPSRFIYVTTNGGFLFFFKAEHNSILCIFTTASLAIHLMDT